jgi:uncharacterized membrane protein (DUF485 family)
MAGFDHKPSEHVERETAAMAARNARYGLRLFFAYLVFYGGFVVLNAFRPQWMGTTWGGINIAVSYGFGLILLALVLALVYGWLCRHLEEAPPSQTATGSEEPRP